MTSTQDHHHASGNTSQDSKDSGGQKSMLELLSITDAAVKALNKSGRSQASNSSHGSKSDHSNPLVKSTHSDRSINSAHSGHSGLSSHSGKSLQIDQLAQSTHSDQSLRSVQSGRSSKSAQGDPMVQSDRSVKSARSDLSLKSGQSGQSVKSHLSGQSVRSKDSGQSIKSHHSIVSVRLSGRSQENNAEVEVLSAERDISYDSGMASKTHTISEEKSKLRGITPGVSPINSSPHERSSDESTTASDVLIRSTIDEREKSLNGNGVNSNSSYSSKCSKTSYGVENFNSTGPQKIKISKKHLREIKAPFDDASPRDSVSTVSSDGKVPSALLGVSSKDKTKSQNGAPSSKMDRKVSSKDSWQRTSNGSDKARNGGQSKSFPKGVDNNDQFKVDKIRKSAEKPYEDVNMISKSKPKPTTNLQQQNKNENSNKQGPSKYDMYGKSESGAGHNTKTSVVTQHIDDPNGQLRSTPKYFVERHTPKKGQTKVTDHGYPEVLPEKKNLLQDLEESIEIVTNRAEDTSSGSSQPEIVTVPERIVTVSSRMSASSSLSDLDIDPAVTKATPLAPPLVSYHTASHRLRDDRSEKEKCLDDSNVIPPALTRRLMDEDEDDLKIEQSQQVQARSQWFSRQASGHGLQQGAPVTGHEAPDVHKDTDVHISDYKLNDKQKSAKELFTRRQGGPVRRIVQPHIVGHDSKASSTSSTGELKPGQPQLGQSNDQVLTAAAAASAAVAATQPFIKAQYEMEAKMCEVLAKINELQSGGGSGEKVSSAVEQTGVVVDTDRVKQLERQVAEMTEKRIDYMESLQAQQLAMQAKLLSMTRESSRTTTHHSRSLSPDSHLKRQDTSLASHTSIPQHGKQAFSKSTVHRSANKENYPDTYHKYSPLDTEESTSPLDTPNPRARAPKPTINNTSEIECRTHRSPPQRRSPTHRPPPQRSPARSSRSRPRSRSPAKPKQDEGILHQILASAGSPLHNSALPGSRPVYNINNPPVLQTRPTTTCESPNVKKAKGLVDDLTDIKNQVKGLVADQETQKYHIVDSTFQDEPHKPANVSTISNTGPFPLDSYLHISDKTHTSPYKSVPELSLSQFNAPLLPGFKDAESILRQVQQNRGFLESNMEAVLRGRQEVEVYTMLEALYNDSSNKEQAHIQKMVDKSIAKLRKEVQREVSDDLVIAELNKKKQTSVPGAVKIPAPVPAKPVNRYGLRGRVAEQPRVEPKKPVVKPAPKRSGATGRENVQQRVSKPPPKKSRSAFEDENYMTQVYGKASYQKGRTTVKDPYLHFQNTAKQKAPRPTGHLETQGGTEMMSSKTQTGGAGGVRQFYFNPATGSYIPIATSQQTAPIPGQLIPMAVPLGGPRMDSGLTIPAGGQYDPSHVPMVTAAGNVAMVTVGTEGKTHSQLSPELAKQVLPAVDIDTDISEMSEIVSPSRSPASRSPVRSRTPEGRPKKHVHIVSPRGTPNKTPGRSPGKPHYEVVYHEDSSPESSETAGTKEEDDHSITITNKLTNSNNNGDRHSDDTMVSDEDADVETATGLQFPGYQSVESPEVPYNGPVFPPRQPSTERQLTSDLIAEDIKRRDLLQNKAMDWIEQELMARIITEVYPLQDVVPPAELSHVVSEGSEDSMAEEKEQSMFVMDSIGHRGMQLFIDAGFPVDNGMVNELVKDVLQEKIRSMLGTRPDEGACLEQPITEQDGQKWEEPVSEEIEEEAPARAPTVRTPEPTPRASPASSPRRHVSPARTPTASPPQGSPRRVVEETEVYIPPPQQAPPTQPIYEPESEPESSASYNIKEELNRLAVELRPGVEPSMNVQSNHDIATPPESPKPLPLPTVEVIRPLTPPEPSPRRPVEDFMMVSQKVVPAAAASRSPERSPTVSTKTPSVKEEQQDTEVEEDLDYQPKPLVFTVAETQTDQVRQSRSPTPVKSESRSPSPESSYTESSSISDTYNECISEGQWLVNKSDGEVADFPINEAAVRDRMLRQSKMKVDVSSASTWKDMDDVDLDDMNEVSRSEGEFLYKADFPPEKDPVLNLLARLQNAGPQLGMYNQNAMATPQAGMFDMSHRQVTDVLANTGKSEGEVIRVAPRQQQQQEGPVRDLSHGSPQKQHQQLAQQRQQQQRQQQRGPQPEREQQDVYRSGSPQQRSGSPHKRAQSPLHRAPSPTRVSFEDEIIEQRPVSPTRGILKQRSSVFEGKGQGQSQTRGRPMRDEDQDIPVRDSGRSPAPRGRITPGGRQPQGRGAMISTGGRPSSPVKSSMGKPPQVIKSSTLPESRSSGGAKMFNVRGSSDDYRDSLENTAGTGYYGTGSEMGTRTPDQMNLDGLIQSGYLSQSFSQSENNGRQTGQSSLRDSADLRHSRTSGGGRSLGYSYGTESSMTMSEIKRLATEGTGKLHMNVTIPGTDMEDSDLSEIDITDGASTR